MAEHLRRRRHTLVTAGTHHLTEGNDMEGKPRDVLERVARQLLQTYGPTLAVVLSSPVAASGDFRATAVTLLSVAIGTTLKGLSGLKSQPGDPLWKVVLDRAGSAFGMQLAGLGIADWAGLLSLDWEKALGAAGAAAALALTMFYVTPPSNAPSPAPADEPSPPAPVAPTEPVNGDLTNLYGTRDRVYDQNDPHGRDLTNGG